uniref:Cadherin domain-containing protein n=1 Tax=Plectus sambesii TaxID=2011161 RepID=A0A914X8T4_9BILA
MGITVHSVRLEPGLSRTCVLLCRMMVFVQLLLPFVHCYAFGSSAPVLVAHDAPVGTIVLDLMRRSDTVPQHSVVSLDTSDYSHLFRLNDKRQIVTRASISRLLDSIVTLDVLVGEGSFERVIPFAVHIVARPTVHFTRSVFNGSVASDAAVNSQVIFDQRISAHTIGSSNVRYAIVSGNTHGLFKLVTKHDPYQDTYALLFVASPLVDASGVHELRIKAVNENSREQFATALLRVTVDERMQQPPVFTAQRYVVSVPRLAPQTTVVRVSATTTNGAVMYRLEPEDIPFDVTPWSGDIFSTQLIQPGRYAFKAVAIDSIGQTTFVSVKIIVEGEIDPLAKKPRSATRRVRRDLGSDMVITLREDTPLGFLQDHIDLLFSERIRGAPVVKNFVTVHSNGSIELTKPLNYEDINPVEVTVFVENMQGGDQSGFPGCVFRSSALCRRVDGDYGTGQRAASTPPSLALGACLFFGPNVRFIAHNYAVSKRFLRSAPSMRWPFRWLTVDFLP